MTNVSENEKTVRIERLVPVFGNRHSKNAIVYHTNEKVQNHGVHLSVCLTSALSKIAYCFRNKSILSWGYGCFSPDTDAAVGADELFADSGGVSVWFSGEVPSGDPL